MNFPKIQFIFYYKIRKGERERVRERQFSVNGINNFIDRKFYSVIN